MPLVSIVIPAHRPDHLREAISSALQQTSNQLGEIVVSDDSGGEEVRIIVNELSKTSSVPIEYFEYFGGGGESQNFWNGIVRSKHSLIKPLHDDDILVPNALEVLCPLIKDFPWVGFVVGSRGVINSNSDSIDPPPELKLAYSLNIATELYFKGPDVLGSLARRAVNFIGEPTAALIRREALLKIGESLMRLDKIIFTPGCGDLTLWVNLLLSYDMIMTPRVVCSHRVWDHSTTAKNNYRQDLRNLLLNGLQVIESRLTKLGYRSEGALACIPLDLVKNNELFDLKNN